MTSNANDTNKGCSFKISYFGFGGRAAALRLTAVLSGIAFEDEFITGAEIKQRQQTQTMRWRGVPEMTIYDANGNSIVTVGQSCACLRYIGTLAGLYPKSPPECALVDEILDEIESLRADIMGPSLQMTDEKEKKAAREALMSKEGCCLPYWFGTCEARLEENEKRGFKNDLLVGDSLTIADLKLYCVCMGFKMGYFNYLPDTLLDDYKRINAFLDKLTDMDNISEYFFQFAQRCADVKAGNTEARCVRYEGKTCSACL